MQIMVGTAVQAAETDLSFLLNSPLFWCHTILSWIQIQICLCYFIMSFCVLKSMLVSMKRWWIRAIRTNKIKWEHIINPASLWCCQAADKDTVAGTRKLYYESLLAYLTCDAKIRFKVHGSKKRLKDRKDDYDEEMMMRGVVWCRFSCCYDRCHHHL